VVLVPGNGALRARAQTRSATNTSRLVNTGFGLRVHLHLAAPRAAPHADILESSTEARLIVTFEVRKRYDNIRICNSRPDFCSLTVLEVNGAIAVPIFAVSQCLR